MPILIPRHCLCREKESVILPSIPKIHEAEDLISALILCTRIMGFVNAPALMQRIVARIQDVTVDVKVYQKKRDLLCDGLAKAGYQI